MQASAFQGFTARAGTGQLEIERVAGKSAVVRAEGNNPLKLLCPQGGGRVARVFTSTYGGGLVSGDAINMRLRLGPGAVCVLGTQASTKIYRSIGDGICTQSLHAIVAENAVGIIAPDPITCYAGSDFEQRQRFDLSSGASLVLVDWLTSGRVARGERWAFRRYLSRNDIFVAGKHVFRDALLLDSSDGPMEAEHRMGGCDCFATVLIVGPRVLANAERLLAWVDAQPVTLGERLIFSASPLIGGAVLRVAGPTTELVAKYVRTRLAFLSELLDEELWARKW